MKGKRIEVTEDNLYTILKAEAMRGDGNMVVLVDHDKTGKYHCQTCTMFVPETGECTNVLGKIEPHGTCQLHVEGKTAAKDAINPFRMLKDEVGYDERKEGFGCVRCIRFTKPNKCKIIKDEVAWNNCCNYQYDGDNNKSREVAEKYTKEQNVLAETRLKSTGTEEEVERKK